MWSRGFLWFCIALVIATAAHATTYYTYDQLGRVTQVTEADGSSTQYAYDADGNITSITHSGGTNVLSIGSVSSSSGAVGSTVTITGSGFSSIPGQDTVTFNGVAATIVYASGNELIVTVPAGATNGDIAVTSPNGSVATNTPYTVVPVGINGFSPTIGAAGTLVTVNGGGFDPTAANDVLALNGTPGTASTATSTQLQFAIPSGATAGHISVSTSQGSAASTGYFVVPASGYSAGQIAVSGAVTTAVSAAFLR